MQVFGITALPTLHKLPEDGVTKAVCGVSLDYFWQGDKPPSLLNGFSEFGAHEFPKCARCFPDR